MNILFTICGRAGSKGIRNKNIKEFIGHPLPYYTLSAIDLFLTKNESIDYDIVVNSDSNELLSIMKMCKKRKIETIIRDSNLAGDRIGKIDVIRNCLMIMEERKKIKYDMVIDLDITSPLRREEDIENLIEMHINKKSDVTTSATMARRNPYFNQVMRTESGVRRVIESNYTARQQAPEIFDLNASLYAYSIEFLKEKRAGVLDGHCEIIEMNDTGILDLDHEKDFELMEVIAKHLFSKNEEYRSIQQNIATL